MERPIATCFVKSSDEDRAEKNQYSSLLNGAQAILHRLSKPFGTPKET